MTHDVATHINDFIVVIIPLNEWFYEINQFQTYFFDIVLQFVKIVFFKFKTNLLVAPQEVNKGEILLHTFFKYSILTNSSTF